MTAENLIEIKNLNARFGGRHILSDVSLRVPRHKITVILGSSGCGKSTVMKHMIGLYPVQDGVVNVLGHTLSELSEVEMDTLKLKMGVLFQNGALLNSLTVADNVSIGLEQHTNLPRPLIDRLVHLKLSLVHLSRAAHLYPAQLSGGMRKRAALARALSLDPRLLFCDEPGAGLDPITQADLADLLVNLREQLGVTLVLVTHEIPTIRRLADHIIFMEKGRIIFQGTLPEAQSAGIERIDDFFEKGK